MSLLAGSGCFVTSSSVESGEAIRPKSVEAIVPGRSTRAEVLELFGPPLAALHPGEEALVRSPVIERVEGRNTLESEVIRYEEQFLLFVDDHAPAEHLAIYYYQQLGSSATAGTVLVAAVGSATADRKRLWVLVDEERGVVEGVVFRED